MFGIDFDMDGDVDLIESLLTCKLLEDEEGKKEEKKEADSFHKNEDNNDEKLRLSEILG